MKFLTPQRLIIIAVITQVMTVVPLVLADGWNPNSKAGNRDSITNTRHNLTQRFSGPGGSDAIATVMDTVRNNYQEVCIYCHTPHGANTAVNAPLWNRTISTTAYTLRLIRFTIEKER